MLWTRDWYQTPIPDSVLVPRVDMPQIEEADYPALFAFLAAQGCGVTRAMVDPTSLRFHQSVSDFDPRLIKGANKPVLTARDAFILDGNHRVKEALYLHRATIDDFRLDRDFEPAIKLLFAFPKTTTTTKG